MVEEEGFGAFKNKYYYCIVLVTIVKNIANVYMLACSQYTRDVYRNIVKIKNVTSSNNTEFPYLFYMINTQFLVNCADTCILYIYFFNITCA